MVAHTLLGTAHTARLPLQQHSEHGERCAHSVAALYWRRYSRLGSSPRCRWPRHAPPRRRARRPPARMRPPARSWPGRTCRPTRPQTPAQTWTAAASRLHAAPLALLACGATPHASAVHWHALLLCRCTLPELLQKDLVHMLGWGKKTEDVCSEIHSYSGPYIALIRQRLFAGDEHLDSDLWCIVEQ